MQEARATSTLELVSNEQQLHNMSQIDLSRPTDNQNTRTQQQQQHQQQANFFSIQGIKELPARIRDGFNAKLDEANSKSETTTEYTFEIIKAFSSIIIWALCLICTIIVPVLLFFIGLFNLDNCPDRPQLPYLVFGIGFVMTASNLFNLALALDIPILTNHNLLSLDTKNTIASILNILFNCIVAFLYILTTYMVYTVGLASKQPKVEPTDNEAGEETKVIVEDEPVPGIDGEKYKECGGLLYHFTFWFVTLTLCLFALLSLFALSLFAYNRYRLAIIRGSTPRSQPNAATNLTTNHNPSTNGTGTNFGSTNNSRMI